ncbi:MAG TPA: tripartite tricarboxylate transporter TctB family protein, partial [Burkholderiales bacterium]|nr:tripartite tricarboxylate transporter TctB family protein [Burkholderiales bacterium]
MADFDSPVGGEGGADDDPPRAVASTRTVDAVACLLLLAFAALMGFDNWRSGVGWATDGPKAG